MADTRSMNALSDLIAVAADVERTRDSVRRSYLEIVFYAGFTRAAQEIRGPSLRYDGGFRGTFVR